MIIDGIFKCQNCGAGGTNLIQEPDTHRMICEDRETCLVLKALEKEND